LFILDLNLPKRSGLQILACIRTNAEHAHIPVLIMTSSDSEKDREETKRLGSSGYFRKPSTFDEFLKIGALIKNLDPRGGS
jgi:DNA-binding response OmpR family regulator